MYNVLFIAYRFPPNAESGAVRAAKLAKFFPRHNWSPVVLTGEDTFYAFNDRSLLKDLDRDSVKIVRVREGDVGAFTVEAKTMPSDRTRRLKRWFSAFFRLPDPQKRWARRAYRKATKLFAEKYFDLIFVTAPPFSSVDLAVRLKKRFGVPVIIDYRDLWSRNPRWSFPTPLHRKIVERMEYNSLKEAEKLTVTNRSMKERIINVRKFIKHTDVAIVSTGYDPDDFAEHVEPPKREKTVFAHLGNASNRRGLRFLFKALAELKAENPALADEIRFRFIGLLRKSDRKAIVKNGISSMIIEDGYLEHKQAIRALRESDVSYISVRDDGFGELFIVGAAAETFAAGKPIVAALPEGALRNRIEEYGACRFADPNSPRAIRRAIEQAHEERKKGTLPTPNEEAVKRFSYDEQVEQLAKIFQFSITEKR